jgi:hypothetical protein
LSLKENSLNHYYNNHQHSVLLYNDTRNRDAYLINYINEGLNKNELCIYGTINLRDKESLEIAHHIVDYEKNISENNLMIVDLAPFYIAALTGNMELFEKIKKEISERIKSRKNKHTRFIGDCASFLFENRHFAQCISIESWWHQRPIKGTYLCPYKKSIFKKYPYNLHKDNIIRENHDIIIDVGSSLSKKLMNDKREENNTIEIGDGEDEKGKGDLIN